VIPRGVVEPGLHVGDHARGRRPGHEAGTSHHLHGALRGDEVSARIVPECVGVLGVDPGGVAGSRWRATASARDRRALAPGGQHAVEPDLDRLRVGGLRELESQLDRRHDRAGRQRRGDVEADEATPASVRRLARVPDEERGPRSVAERAARALDQGVIGGGRHDDLLRRPRTCGRRDRDRDPARSAPLRTASTLHPRSPIRATRLLRDGTQAACPSARAAGPGIAPCAWGASGHPGTSCRALERC